MLGVVTSMRVPGATGQIILARIVGAKATPISQATISSVTVQVTDLSKEALTVGSGNIATHSPAVASVIFNALQQGDPLWEGNGGDSSIAPGKDKLWGYNFLFTVPAADFGNSGDLFQVDVKVVPVSGEPFRIRVKIPTDPVYV